MNEFREKERRAHDRIPVKIPVKFTDLVDFFVDYALDISQGGMFIQMEKLLEIGTPIRVRLSLPEEKESFEANGVVVRTVEKAEGEAPHHKPRGVGIKFEALSPEDKQLIDKKTKKMEGLLEVGTSVKVRFSVPEEEKAFEASGVVVRSDEKAKGEDTHQKPTGVGIRFETLIALKTSESSTERPIEASEFREEDRRIHERIPVKIPVKFTDLVDFFVEYALDISQGGMFIQMEELLEIGTPVRVRFSLPEEKEAIEVNGVVVHTVGKTEGKGIRQEPKGVGIRFEALSPEEKRIIDRLWQSKIQEESES